MNAKTTERTFSIDEIKCFPKGCKLPEDMQPMLATVLVPQLEAAGMKVVEWTRGALMLEEPFLSQVKSIVCRGCMHFECEHNTTPHHGRSGDILDDITECFYSERQKANADLAEALIPHQSVEGWVAQGIVVSTPFVMSSRTRFHLSVTIKHPTKGETTLRISRKKGERGEICVYGSNTAEYPMPRTSAETRTKLHEIISAAI